MKDDSPGKRVNAQTVMREKHWSDLEFLVCDLSENILTIRTILNMLFRSFFKEGSNNPTCGLPSGCLVEVLRGILSEEMT